MSKIETKVKKRQKLRELRLQNHYTYKDMSKRTGLSLSFYWQIENGKRNLTYENAKNIAKIFNLKPDDVFYVND